MGANFKRNQRAGVTASAGYPQFRDTIQTPIFSDRIIGRTYKDSVTSRITTGNFLQGLQKCGSSVGFRVEARVEVFDYQENQPLDTQVPENCWRWVHINKAKYFNIKIDAVTEATICDWKTEAQSFCSSAAKSLKEKLDPEILIEMALASSTANRGNNAGPEGTFDFGSYSAPLTITPTNIVSKFVQAQIAMSDQADGSRWEAGKMVVILPNIAKTVIQHPQSGIGGFGGVCCTTTIPGATVDIDDWEIIYSNNVPYQVMPDGSYAYYIIFAHKDATGFVQQLERCEVKDSYRSFGQYYRGLWVYGNGTLIPEGIVVMFAKFNAQV